MIRKERIIFDLDDVIVVPNILKIANEIADEEKRIEELNHYYLEECFSFTEEQSNFFYDQLVTKNLYEGANFIEGAYNTLKELSEDYDIFIASDSVIYKRERLSGKLFADKFDFIVNNLPFINPRNIVLCGDKSIISGKWFVDDKLENLEKAENIKHKLLFPAYHNTRISDEELIAKNILRIKEYSHLKRFIERKLTNDEIEDIISKVFKMYFEEEIVYTFNYYCRSHEIFIKFEDEKKKYSVQNHIIDDCKNNLITKLQSLLGVNVNFY